MHVHLKSVVIRNNLDLGDFLVLWFTWIAFGKGSCDVCVVVSEDK